MRPQSLQMPAAGLSAESGAPILMLGADSVPAATAAALRSLKHPSIYVIDPAGVGRAGACSASRGFGHVTPILDTSRRPRPRRRASGAVATRSPCARFTDGTFGWGVKEPGHGLGVRERRAPARRPRRGPAVGHRRLRAAAAARRRRWGSLGPGRLPVGHPARLQLRAPVPAGPRHVQSRLADRRRTSDLAAHAGRNRLHARDHPPPPVSRRRTLRLDHRTTTTARNPN